MRGYGTYSISERRRFRFTPKSGKPGTIRESNKASGRRKSSILLTGTGVRKISYVAEITSVVSAQISPLLLLPDNRITAFNVFFNKISLWRNFIEKYIN